MKISEMSLEKLLALSYEEKWKIICGNVRDDGCSGDVALLLGSMPSFAIDRAHTAAKLYLSGRVKHIVASGGVFLDYNGERLTEAELMSRILQKDGVPESAIILDNEARTTKENMICGTLVINRTLKFNNIEHIIIVTSQNHMQRSLALAKAFLPRKVTVSGYPFFPAQPVNEWLSLEENRCLLDNAIRLTKGLVDDRIVEDIKCW